jgi:RES domain-containing protein
MIVYRLSKTKFARDLTGEGARLNGGRWNHPLAACLYTAQSRSLAILEYTVNVNIDDIPRALSLVTLQIPDSSIDIYSELLLPGDWKAAPAPASTRDFGTNWLKAARNLMMQVPSTIVPEEWNIIINPLHPNMKECKIVNIRDFVYDVRIKLK